MTGGADADTFVYALVTQSNSSSTDSITDFVSGTDKLQVTLNYGSLTSALTIAADVTTAKAGTTLLQDSLSGSRGQAVYDTTASALYINVNADNLVTTSDYKININPATTAANTVASADINFVITGGTNDDVITSGSGADTIDGGTGADSITGGAGVDSITAGTGADTITGGTGADSIVLGAGGEIDTLSMIVADIGDTVTGFAAAEDRIDWNTALLATDGSTTAVTYQAAAAGTAIGATTTVFELTGVTGLTGAAALVTALGGTATNADVDANILFVYYITGGGVEIYNWINLDANVEAGELTLVATLTGVAGDAITTADFV